MARGRSRSPRGAHRYPDDLPIVDFLVSRHILDDRSANALKKVPRDFAIDVLVSIGPEVRNPSAFVTRRLQPALGQPSEAPAAEPVGNQRLEPSTRDFGPTRDTELDHATDGSSITFTIYVGGNPQELVWVSQEQAVGELKTWGVLDEASGDFMLKAPEQDAKAVLEALGPGVKNPSAFATRKLKDLKASAAQLIADKAAAGETPVQVFFNGEYHELDWVSKEDALGQLVAWGVLDDGSADFLMKAPEHHAKATVASIGPEVRNPSAFVTRKLKELRVEASRQGPSVEDGWFKEDVIMVHFGGSAKPLHWESKEQAVDQLIQWGVLDEISADFLAKSPDKIAKEVTGSIGPEVRNPSAFVTRKVKELLEGASNHRDSGAGINSSSVDRGSFTGGGMLGPGGMAGSISGAGNVNAGGCGRGAASCGVGGCSACGMQSMMMGCSGVSMCSGMGGGLTRRTQELVASFVNQGVLDQESAKMLNQVPDAQAKDILNGLGPDVRNPSAWVTKQIKEIMRGQSKIMTQNPMMGGMHMVPAMMPVSQGMNLGMSGGMQGRSILNVHCNGGDLSIPWTSQSAVLEVLERKGVLDQKSADYLAKLPEQGAWEILSALGPEVRNPSAFVTQNAKKWQERNWGV